MQFSIKQSKYLLHNDLWNWKRLHYCSKNLSVAWVFTSAVRWRGPPNNYLWGPAETADSNPWIHVTPIFAIIKFCPIRSALGCITWHSILAFSEIPLESRNSLPKNFWAPKFTQVHLLAFLNFLQFSQNFWGFSQLFLPPKSSYSFSIPF
jgi:hypothetical protein